MLGELLYALTDTIVRMGSQRRSEMKKVGLARAVAQGRKLGRPVGADDDFNKSWKIIRNLIEKQPLC